MPTKDPDARKRQSREASQRYRERHPDRVARTLRNQDPKYERERTRKYREKHPHKAREFRCNRYGLSLSEYEAMLVRQNGVCAICRKPERETRNGKTVELCIDHDHETGRVRGLLCRRCNAGQGNFNDDPALLRAAADYIERFK